MEKTNKNAELINQIFDTICIIYDENEFNFDSPAEIINKFQGQLKLAINLDVKDIAVEIWNATTKFHRRDRILELLNSKFEKLLTWKYISLKIEDLNIEVKKGFEPFFIKQSHINIHYTPLERVQIQRAMIAISHRLFKIKLDLNKVLNQLQKMMEEENKENVYPELQVIKFNNVKLHPDKVADFVKIMLDLYEKGYFIPVDSTILFSKEVLLDTLADSMHTTLHSSSIPDTVSINPTVEQISISFNGKSFPEYLLHKNKYKLVEEIRKEFSTEKSKSIRYLLEALAQSQPPLITIIDGDKMALYNALKEFFNRDIGSYNSIFQCKFNPDSDTVDKQNLEKFTIRINHILDKL